jgi:hypothetical protein
METALAHDSRSNHLFAVWPDNLALVVYHHYGVGRSFNRYSKTLICPIYPQ